MQVIIWKPIIGYEGFYEVSNYGAIRSNTRVVTLPDGSRRKIEGKLLTPKRNQDGYLFVSLSKDGFTQTKYIHRLVADAFVPNPDGFPEVNHLNGNKQDNIPDNLEWCTHQQNVQHAYDNGFSTNKGGTHSFAITVIDNELGRTFETEKEWCDARGINYSTGRNILNGQRTRRIDLTKVFKVSKTNDK